MSFHLDRYCCRKPPVHTITVFNDVIFLPALELLKSAGWLWHNKIKIASTILLLPGPSGERFPGPLVFNKTSHVHP